jgi:pantoate--beta-alanine ligase
MLQVVKKPAELQKLVRQVKKEGKTIGLVPTMGALHEGHASLIAAAHAENDFVIVSDFVNPTQFAPNEDLDAYPRTFDADCKLAEEKGADVLFFPTPADMYPSQDDTWVEVTGNITKCLCGRTRPIHFRGVATVVTKLFHLAQPDRAYFGQKDAQQAEVLKRMVKDLFFPLEIREMPIVREPDGLAKSSRNVYLTPEQRKAALVLSRSLFAAQDAFNAGEVRTDVLVRQVREAIEKEPMADIDYVEMHALPELTDPHETVDVPHLLAVAVKFGTTRLIDNVILEPKKH